MGVCSDSIGVTDRVSAQGFHVQTTVLVVLYVHLDEEGGAVQSNYCNKNSRAFNTYRISVQRIYTILDVYA
jgi:hypothetical protein